MSLETNLQAKQVIGNQRIECQHSEKKNQKIRCVTMSFLRSGLHWNAKLLDVSGSVKMRHHHSFRHSCGTAITNN